MSLIASIDAERALLGVLIRDGRHLPPEIRPSDFAEPKHIEIAGAMLALEAQGIPPDELVVNDYLRQVGSSVLPIEVPTLTSDHETRPYNPAWAELILRAASLRLIKSRAAKAQQEAELPDADPDALARLLDVREHLRRREGDEEGLEHMTLGALEAFDRFNDPDSVIGDRWLTRGGSMLLVSQSGVGKSSFATQLMICLATHRPFFGIRAKRPLRIVYLQAENCLGDVAEGFVDICAGLNLHAPERATLEENLHIYRDSTSVGPAFLARLEQLTKKHAPDLVVVDPLLSYCGIEVADQVAVTEFCRHQLAPYLEASGVVLLAIHHTTKPRTAKDREGQTISDLAYSGAGASELVNFVREVGVIQRLPGEEPVFRFGLTKRRNRAGLRDAAGERKGEILLRHAREPGVIRWEYATEADLAGTPPQQPTRPQSQTPSQSSVKGSRID